MLVDTHAHLNMDPLYEQWPTVVAAAKTAGVERFIIPAADILSSQRGIEIAAAEPTAFAAVGIHPESSTETSVANIVSIADLATQAKVVGIGEIGLDYLKENAPVEAQRTLFRNQLAIAREKHLPAIIHSRTEAAMQDAVVDIRTVYGTTPFVGVFHCFTGSQGFFETITGLGALVGVGGMITYERQATLRQVVSTIPLESIILETDAPWLTPSPRPRGVNTPANVTIVAVTLAALHEVQLTKVLEITGENACRLFPDLKASV